MNYSFSYEIAAISILIIVIRHIWNDGNIGGKTQKVFFATAVWNLIACILDILSGIAIQHFSEIPLEINYFLNTFYQLSTALYTINFAYYMVCYVREQCGKSYGFTLNNIVMVVYLLLHLINTFSGCIYYFDETLGYQHGKLWIVTILVPAYYLLYASLVLFGQWNRFTKKLRWAIMLGIGISSGFILVQAVFFPHVLMALFGGAVAILTAQLSMETPDYRALIKTMDELEEARHIAEEARIAAQNADKAKSDFLARMSHEIRTPINAVLGMDEMILRESKNPDIIEYAKDIRSAGKNLLSLINDILDFSKIENGRMELFPKAYELGELLNDTYSMIARQMREKGLDFRLENNPELPSVLFGDEVRIRQIINNLLSNALKYTKEGGVYMSIQGECLSPVNMVLQIRVKDTGVGINDINIVHIFDAFQRVDEKKNRFVEGSGLGLSITKQLVEQMNGTIRVQSEMGVGTEFVVMIPQRILDAKPLGDYTKLFYEELDDAMHPATGFVASKARILVVDDVLLNLKVVVNLLKETKLQIDTATSGKECIALACENKYDLILLDHMMPEMDGIETKEQLSHMEENKNVNTPIIMLTANAVHGAKEEYLSMGFTDYLSKPVLQKDLNEILIKYLPADLLEGHKEPDCKEETKVSQNRMQGVHEEIAEAFSLDDTMYRNLMSEFVKEENIEHLTNSFAGKDWQEYRKRVHFLKDNAFVMGGMELSEFAGQIEEFLKMGSFDKVEECHQELMDGYRELTEQMKTKLKMA